MVPLTRWPDRNRDARRLVGDTTYWFGLFSHRRADDVWKGMLYLELDTVAEDDLAKNALRARMT
jgi:hypothetical protein